MKKNIKKTLLLIALAWIACSTALAQTPTPAFGGGSGTRAEPYLITSNADWDALANFVNSGNACSGNYFVLTTDLTGITTVIGNNITNPFRGHFDGWGHEVDVNINVIATGYDVVGVFGSAQNDTIKNLGVKGSIKGANSAGFMGPLLVGFIGRLDEGYIENCYNLADIESIDNINVVPDARANGIANLRLSCQVRNCYSAGTLKSVIACGIGTSVTGSSVSNSFAANDTIKASAVLILDLCLPAGIR